MRAMVLPRFGGPGVFELRDIDAPNPQTNADFMRSLRRAHGRPWCPPTPAPLVRLGCFILRTEPVLALTGRRVLPKRFMEMGFDFRFPNLSDALANIIGDAGDQGSSVASSASSFA